MDLALSPGTRLRMWLQRRRLLAIVGDVIFQGLIGRTELFKRRFRYADRVDPGRLWPLGDDVAFIPAR